LTSLRFWAGSSTVLTPARRAPISFSLMPPTAVMRPRREISPCCVVKRGEMRCQPGCGSRMCTVETDVRRIKKKKKNRG
jgi:hypothetical protein